MANKVKVRIGDAVRHPSASMRDMDDDGYKYCSPAWRWIVTGFYQWDGPQMVRLVHEDDSTMDYEAPEAELVHADDAITRLGKLV